MEGWRTDRTSSYGISLSVVDLIIFLRAVTQHASNSREGISVARVCISGSGGKWYRQECLWEENTYVSRNIPKPSNLSIGVHATNDQHSKHSIKNSGDNHTTNQCSQIQAQALHDPSSPKKRDHHHKDVKIRLRSWIQLRRRSCRLLVVVVTRAIPAKQINKISLLIILSVDGVVERTVWLGRERVRRICLFVFCVGQSVPSCSDWYAAKQGILTTYESAPKSHHLLSDVIS